MAGMHLIAAMRTRTRQFLRAPVVLMEYLTGRLARTRPIVLRLCISTRCNADCPFCPDRSGIDNQFMPLHTFKALLDKALPWIELVDFSFAGDPLLHPDLFEMIAYAKGHDLAVNLHTNARALTDERIERLVASGADLVVINLNALAKTWSVPMEAEDFDPGRIDRLNGYLQANAGTKTPVVLQLIVPSGAAHINRAVLAGLFAQARNTLLRIKPMRECSYDAQPPAGKRLKCYRLLQDISVGPDGSFVLCCYDTLLRRPLGNVLSQQFPKAWVEAMNEISHGSPSPLCRNCIDNRLAWMKILANCLLSPARAYSLFRRLSGRGL